MALVKASHRFARISATKVRPFADMIRGKTAREGLVALKFQPNRGARFLEKVLQSAIANAEDRSVRNVDALKISDPGKAVVLSGGGRGEEFVVEIAVTGTGVDVEDLETSQSLAIARRFAARDGGTITINTGTDARSLHFVSSFRPMIHDETETGQARQVDSRQISMIGPKAAG